LLDLIDAFLFLLFWTST